MALDTLPPGFELEQDEDGDWVLIPPPDVTIVSEPGEPLLIGDVDYKFALEDALQILDGIIL